MNPDNKCFLNFLRENELLVDSDNVTFANNAFKIHSVVNSTIRESRGAYESKEDFLSKVNLIECLIQSNKKNSQTIDKKQQHHYTDEAERVHAPTAIKMPPTSVPVPACTHTHMNPEQILDKWMIQE